MLPALRLNDQIALALGVLGLLFLLINLLRLRKNKFPHLPAPAKDAVAGLVHASSEEGKRLVVSLGHNLTSGYFDLAGASGLSLQRALLKRSLFNDYPLQSFSGDRRVGPNPEALVGGIERVGHDLDPLPHEGATTILEVD